MSPWNREFWRLALLLAVTGGMAALAGEPAWGLCAGLAVYLSWHLWQLRRLELWLAGRGKRLNDGRQDIWAEVAAQVLRIKRRSQKRKRRLSLILKQFLRSTAALPDGTVVLSADSRIVWFNQSAQRLLGLRAPQDNGQWVANLIRTPAFIRYLDGGDYDEAVEIISSHMPECTLSLQIIPYGEDQRLLVIRDVTRERRLDRVRKDFVANASHELRTPLTVLSGYVETLLGEAEEELASWSVPLAAMREQTARMEQLLSDLLLLSRLDESPRAMLLRPVDLAALLRRCCAEASRLAAGQVTLQVKIAEPLVLRGVESELRSVFDNLLSNAIKYTVPGGAVHLETAMVGEELEVVVADTGIGIAPEHLPRLTERFYRVDSGRAREQGGTGLGLAIVKHALQRHEAQLMIESRLGIGSRFICRFPRDRVLEAPGLSDCGGSIPV
jgi:two-component system phosphate regulon sensor histidine kinase PhoR